MPILEVWVDLDRRYAGCQWRDTPTAALQTCRVPLLPDGGMRWEDLCHYPVMVVEALYRWTGTLPEQVPYGALPPGA